jgi:hypothetical protein
VLLIKKIFLTLALLIAAAAIFVVSAYWFETQPIATAFSIYNKGEKVKNFDDVKPGDFVQFWNIFNN